MSALTVSGGSGAGASVGGKQANASVPATSLLAIVIFNETGDALGNPGCPAFVIDVAVPGYLGEEINEPASLAVNSYAQVASVRSYTDEAASAITVDGFGPAPGCAMRRGVAVRVSPYTWHARLQP